jgi:UDP:flavonoid glycosyltransferase YjiC (YdhE family)
MDTSPRTILLAPASAVPFQVCRCLALAEKLSRRGHRIICVGAGGYLRDLVITSGDAYECS